MSQSGYGYRPGMTPSAPPLLAPSAEDDMAPPTYEEAIQAPGGSFSNLPSQSRPEGGGSGVVRPAPLTGGTADLRADIEAGTRSPGPADVTVTADPQTPAPAPATGGTGDDPPSYQSDGQISEDKESRSGIADFFSKLILTPIFCYFFFVTSPVLSVMVGGLVFGLPLTLITIGSIYIHDCPIEPGIPIWMVVGGVVIIVYIFWVSCTDEESSTYQGMLGFAFYLAWYIAGCVIIYRTWQPDFQPSYPGDTLYCDYTLMLTAFITINLLSVLTGVACCTGAL